MKDNKKEYVPGDRRTRMIFLAFLAFWVVTGLILKEITETNLAQINELSKTNPHAALKGLNHIFMSYGILPMSFFLSIQGIYFLYVASKTAKARIYPPPRITMPFRTKVQGGFSAYLMSAVFFFVGACNFVIIGLLLKAWNTINKFM